jgi:hypothetical protein
VGRAMTAWDRARGMPAVFPNATPNGFAIAHREPDHMRSLTPATLVTRKPDLLAADMDGDVVMMSIAQGAYYGIGGVGPRVWELLATPSSVRDLTAVICAEFAVDETTCGTDIQAFVEQLMAHDLVSVA